MKSKSLKTYIKTNGLQAIHIRQNLEGQIGHQERFQDKQASGHSHSDGRFSCCVGRDIQ